MQRRRYNYAWVFSILLHVIVLLALIVSFEFSGLMPVFENVNNNSKIISAVAMNSPVVSSEPSLPPPPPPPRPEPKKPEIVKQQQPKPAPIPAKQAVKEQPKSNTDAIALKKLERKKQLALQKDLIAKQLLADLQKQKKKIDKTKHKTIEDAMAKELQEAAEKSLQQQLLNEQRQVSSARAQGIVDKYKALILQAISNRWVVPTGVNKKLSAELLIRLAPGGLVLDVQVTRSSGDVSLDRSARAAVFKASPLPVPPKTEEFSLFRQFVLKVKPQDIVNNAV